VIGLHLAQSLVVGVLIVGNNKIQVFMLKYFIYVLINLNNLNDQKSFYIKIVLIKFFR